MPNLTNALAPIDLSTVAKIVAKMDLSSVADERTAYIGLVITEVSSQITEFLGMHLLAEERTERYELRKFSKRQSLDAINLTGTTTVRVSAHASQVATATPEVVDETYILNARSGVIRLLGDQPFNPAYLSITYTGGFFANAGELGTKHLWLTDAAELQILYRLQRQDTLGGNVDTSGGQGTNFQGAYNFLAPVRNMLRAHRRIDA